MATTTTNFTATGTITSNFSITVNDTLVVIIFITDDYVNVSYHLFFYVIGSVTVVK